MGWGRMYCREIACRTRKFFQKVEFKRKGKDC